MTPGEKLAARWLTEEWDEETKKIPSWLKRRIWEDFPGKLIHSPDELAQFILLRILRDHKSEIRLENF